MTQLSKYLTLEMATESATAQRLNIDNIPNEEQINALREWGVHIYDKIAGKFPRIQRNSIFRCKALNDAIGGSLTSQHMKGEAGDLKLASRADNVMLLKWVIDNIHFDQCICEFPNDQGPAWLHLSWHHELKNRDEILVASGVQTGRGATYAKFTGKEIWYIKEKKV